MELPEENSTNNNTTSGNTSGGTKGTNTNSPSLPTFTSGNLVTFSYYDPTETNHSSLAELDGNGNWTCTLCNPSTGCVTTQGTLPTQKTQGIIDLVNASMGASFSTTPVTATGCNPAATGTFTADNGELLLWQQENCQMTMNNSQSAYELAATGQAGASCPAFMRTY